MHYIYFLMHRALENIRNEGQQAFDMNGDKNVLSLYSYRISLSPSPGSWKKTQLFSVISRSLWLLRRPTLVQDGLGFGRGGMGGIGVISNGINIGLSGCLLIKIHISFTTVATSCLSSWIAVANSTGAWCWWWCSVASSTSVSIAVDGGDRGVALKDSIVVLNCSTAVVMSALRALISDLIARSSVA